MPVVPKYDSPQIQQAPIPGARFNTEAPLAAFGGGQAQQGVNNAIDAAAGDVFKIAAKEKETADDTATKKAYADALTVKNNLIYDPQSGVMTRKGQDALGVVDEYQPKFKKSLDDIENGLANQDQKDQFQSIRAAQEAEFNGSLQKHIATESQVFAEQTNKAALEASMNDAVLNYHNPGAVEKNIETQKAIILSRARDQGIEGPIADQQISDVTSKTYTAVIGRMLANGDDQTAQKFYEANKDKITDAADATAIEKSLESSKTASESMDAWNKVKNFRLSDGTPNEAKMQSAIYSDPNVSVKKKDEIWSFVKARAAEQTADKNKQDQANDRSFLNNVIKTRQQGQPMDEALKLVQRFSTDPYDQATKTEAVKKIYAPPTDSDPQTKYKLWEGIQEGTTTGADLDAALQKNMINSTDWTALKEDRYRIEIEGRSPEMKSVKDRVQQLAIETFGSDKEKQRAFELEVSDSARGKSPEEYWKIAQDKLKTDPSTQKHFLWMNALPFGGGYQYQSDQQKRDATNLAFGKANQDLGPEVVKAIGQGYSRLGNKSFQPSDLESFTQRVGGYQNLKPGTPVNNAIQSLMKRNKPVVPENIKAVLDKYPDGKY